MRALVFDDGLGFRDDYPHPALHDNEALVRVSCAGICNTDIEITKGYMGFTGVLGHEGNTKVLNSGNTRFISVG